MPSSWQRRNLIFLKHSFFPPTLLLPEGQEGPSLAPAPQLHRPGCIPFTPYRPSPGWSRPAPGPCEVTGSWQHGGARAGPGGTGGRQRGGLGSISLTLWPAHPCGAGQEPGPGSGATRWKLTWVRRAGSPCDWWKDIVNEPLKFLVNGCSFIFSPIEKSQKKKKKKSTWAVIKIDLIQYVELSIFKTSSSALFSYFKQCFSFVTASGPGTWQRGLWAHRAE